MPFFIIYFARSCLSDPLPGFLPSPQEVFSSMAEAFIWDYSKSGGLTMSHSLSFPPLLHPFVPSLGRSCQVFQGSILHAQCEPLLCQWRWQ